MWALEWGELAMTEFGQHRDVWGRGKGEAFWGGGAEGGARTQHL